MKRSPGVVARAAVGMALLSTSIAVASPAGAAEVEVSIHLEPRNLAAGDVAELTLEARGGVFGRVRFQPRFELANFEVVDGPRRFEGVSVVDGAARRSFRLSWRLRALAPGPAAVRGVELDFGGERLTLPDARAAVGAAPVAGGLYGELDADRRRSADPDVFLRAEAAPDRPWTGQQVVYSLWLYTQVRVSSMSLAEAPQFPGFWVEELPVPDGADGEAVEVDGALYLRKLLLRRALFPLRPGRLALAPSEAYLLVAAPRRDPFGPLLSGVERLERRSEPLVVEARPLPPPPPGFTGLVGSIDLATRLTPAELAVGEAATLEVELSGRGHLQGAPAPAIPAPPGLGVSPPAADGARELTGTAVGGSRRWSYAVVPEASGLFRLPPVEVTYFDPAAGEYRVAAGGPLLLRARAAGRARSADAGPGPGPNADPDAAGAAESVADLDAAALTADPDAAGAAARPAGEALLWRRLLPWLLALPSGALLAILLVRRRRGRRGGGDRARRRFADRLVRAGEEGRPRQAAVAIEAAWRELLAERWRLDPATPSSHWRDRLLGAGAAAEAAAGLGTLVDDLRYLRHAPQLSTLAALRGELIERSRGLEPKLAPAGDRVG